MFPYIKPDCTYTNHSGLKS